MWWWWERRRGRRRTKTVVFFRVRALFGVCTGGLQTAGGVCLEGHSVLLGGRYGGHEVRVIIAVLLDQCVMLRR
jgi:hypothetical protein